MAKYLLLMLPMSTS